MVLKILGYLIKGRRVGIFCEDGYFLCLRICRRG